MGSGGQYDRLVASLRELPEAGHGDPRRALVQAAILAASSHNTQPWRFRIAPAAITIEPDLARRCPVVDPDDSHLFKSLGCSAENIVAAAPAYGFQGHVRPDIATGSIVVDLESRAPVDETEPLKAIAERQCTRHPYDGRPLSPDEAMALESAGLGDGVHVRLIDDSKTREDILEYVSLGNRDQLSDPAFRRELVAWMRFNPAAAIRTGDGLSGRTAGQPAIPTWLGRLIIGLVLTPHAQIGTDARNLRSSAGIVVFVADTDDRPAWIETGRAYERFALAATVRGIRNAFINQPIEVRRLRPQLHALLGLTGTQTAQLLVRYGFAQTAPYSLRRPLDAVITDSRQQEATG